MVGTKANDGVQVAHGTDNGGESRGCIEQCRASDQRLSGGQCKHMENNLRYQGVRERHPTESNKTLRLEKETMEVWLASGRIHSDV